MRAQDAPKRFAITLKGTLHPSHVGDPNATTLKPAGEQRHLSAPDSR